MTGDGRVRIWWNHKLVTTLAELVGRTRGWRRETIGAQLWSR